MERLITICAVATVFLVAAAVSGSGEDNSITSDPDQLAICDSLELEYYSSALWSVINEVTVAGDLAYCATANGLMVIDVSDRHQVKIAATYSERMRCMSVTLDSSILYLGTADSGLLIFDVSDPTTPQLTCHIKSPAKVWDVAVDDSTMYQLGNDSLQVYRLAGTQCPVLLGSTDYALRVGVPKRSLALEGNTIYVAAGMLSSIDVSVNSRPAVLDTITTRHLAVDVAVSGSLAVVADKSNWISGYRSSVTLMDISAPDSLSMVGFFEYRGSIWDVEVDSGYVFVAADGDGIAVLDISEPSAPVPVACYPAAGAAQGISVSGSSLYVANIKPPLPDEVVYTQTLCNQHTYPDTVAQSLPENVTAGDFLIIDIEDLDNLYLAGHLRNPGYTQLLAISGDIVFSADELGSLVATKIRYDYTREPIGFLQIGPAPQSLTAHDELLLVPKAYGGLSIIDVSDPGKIAEVGVYNSEDWISDATIAGDTAYVCENTGGLSILDISSPESPQLVSNTSTADAATAVIVDSIYCYVACRYGGLEVYDISNARSPARVGKYPPVGQDAWIIYLAKEEHILVAGASSYLYVLDISDPANPTLLSELHTHEAFDIALRDGLLYVARGRDGVDVIDLSDPSSPCKVGGTGGVHFALKAVLGEHTLLVANWLNLLEFRLPIATDVSSDQKDRGALPSNMILHQNYPNPFNPTTTFAFSLQSTARVSLEIFNILGQRVAKLTDQTYLPGRHEVSWDGRNDSGGEVVSGVYFSRLRSGETTITRKLMLLR